MNSDKYLFITDLDGTLLTTDKRVTPATAKALREFVGEGNHFAICTGRDINSARSVYCGLGLTLPGSFVIAYNGGQIYDVDKAETVYRTGIDFDTVREIYQLADEYGNWRGGGFGSLYQETVGIADVIAPEDARAVVVWQTMQGCDTLQGLDDVGIIVRPLRGAYD